MVVSLSELILTKKTLIFLELSMKYFDMLNYQVKKISKRLLQLEFKSDNNIKSNNLSLKKYCLIISNNGKTYCVGCKKYTAN